MMGRAKTVRGGLFQAPSLAGFLRVLPAGLGLSLAKEWAELFGGSLTYHPAAGGGACFRLELPG